jgi:GH15 family glucan-1,4-alpha-glucosidase
MPASHAHYPPIEDHGVIGNLHTCALVSLEGTIDYCCWPRFDSPTVFASLLDREKGGFFEIYCLGENVNHRQLYLPDTAILLTRYFSDQGIAELSDFMPVVKKQTEGVLFRELKSIRGTHQFRVRVQPRFDYARAEVAIREIENGFAFYIKGRDEPEMCLTTDAELAIHPEGYLEGEVTLNESERLTFVLSHDDRRHLPSACEAHFFRTRDFWTNWIAQCTYKGRWQTVVSRSAITLKLLTSLEHGSTIAAATFGLPEAIGGARNWDYRFTWIRDAAFTMYAFLRLGFRDEAEAFIEWIQQRCSDNLQLLYAIDGERELTESELDHFAGYRNSRPVRIGNAAFGQKQMDIYGELIDTVYLYNQAGGSITYEFWQSITTLVEYVIAHWRDKDHGIWEVRNEEREFLYSRVCCWVAIDRAIRIAEDRSFPTDMEHWYRVRDEIYQDIYHNFWNEERGAYVQYKGGDVLDASALLMPLLRVVSSKEPRWLATFERIREELSTDVMVYRYHLKSGASDGLEDEEGAFLICSFWYVECLARIGHLDEATLAFEKLLGYGNHLGLFSEEIGLHGEQLGNFPQAFSHLSLISAAFQLDKRNGD